MPVGEPFFLVKKGMETMNSGETTNKAQRYFSFCSYSTHICISILSLLVKSSVLFAAPKWQWTLRAPVPPADFPWKKGGFSMARNWGSGHAGNAIHQGHLVDFPCAEDRSPREPWKPPHMSANSCFNMFQHVSTCFNMFQHVSGHVSSHTKKTGHVVQ